MICSKHPKYTGKKPPKTCKQCWQVYYLELERQAQEIVDKKEAAADRACDCTFVSSDHYYSHTVSQTCPVHRFTFSAQWSWD
jgi:hypothetical protein